MKKARRSVVEQGAEIESRVFSFRGLCANIDDEGTLHIEVPVHRVAPMNGPLLSEEARQWAQDEGISESTYMAAYDAADTAFYKKIEEEQLFDVLRDSQVL